MSLILISLIIFSHLELRATLVDTLFYPREEIFLDIVFTNRNNDTVRVLRLFMLQNTPDGLRFHIKNEKGVELIWRGIQMTYVLPRKETDFQGIPPSESLVIDNFALNGEPGKGCSYVSPTEKRNVCI